MDLPVRPPVDPMLAKLARALPTDDGWSYEPKWDGFRCLVFRDVDELELQSRNGRSLVRYFPEMVEPLREQLPSRCVLDGELVIAGDDGLDFDRLSLRIHPADSRVDMLAEQMPASYVAFDLLAVGDEALLDEAFVDRRTRLEKILENREPPLFLTPATTDRAVAADWFTRFEGAGLDGVVAKGLRSPYRPGARDMLKLKHERTADCVVGGYRLHKDGEGVGSLLLGLFDDAGVLHHVGVASSMKATLRGSLLEDVRPLESGALDGHPWREWADESAHASEGTRMPGAPSRWNASKDLSWTPLRPERVVEVAYEHMQGTRFRHNARFRRWRPDRDPRGCTYAQLEVAAPVELSEVFAPRD
ncbi:MAG: ATP-dependent DNA ligase [Acidimicrobiia bacterium]|nr:ATP-dependent DNA ligase [Acidimicrobiia bacterium]